MPNWIDEQIARQRYYDILVAEQQRQVAAAALAESRRPARFYSPVLLRLGRRMLAWGSSLEARYGPVVEPQIVTDSCAGTARR